MTNLVKTGFKAGIVASAGLALFTVGYLAGNAVADKKAKAKRDVEEMEHENAKCTLAVIGDMCADIVDLVKMTLGDDYDNEGDSDSAEDCFEDAEDETATLNEDIFENEDTEE